MRHAALYQSCELRHLADGPLDELALRQRRSGHLDVASFASEHLSICGALRCKVTQVVRLGVALGVLVAHFLVLEARVHQWQRTDLAELPAQPFLTSLVIVRSDRCLAPSGSSMLYFYAIACAQLFPRLCFSLARSCWYLAEAFCMPPWSRFSIRVCRYL